MPSLKSIRKSNLVDIKVGDESTGLFLRPMSFEDLDKLNSFEQTTEGGKERILFLFVNFICDENGESFDDVTSIEEVDKNADALLVKQILLFITDLFSINLPQGPK